MATKPHDLPRPTNLGLVSRYYGSSQEVEDEHPEPMLPKPRGELPLGPFDPPQRRDSGRPRESQRVSIIALALLCASFAGYVAIAYYAGWFSP